MRDRMGCKEGGREVVCVPGLPSMRPEHEGVKPARLPPVIEASHVGIHIIDPIRERRVLVQVPKTGIWKLTMNSAFGL